MNLRDVLCYLYSDNHRWGASVTINDTASTSFSHHIIIPVGDKFEMPLFAFRPFIEYVASNNSPDVTHINAFLEYAKYDAYHTTTEPILKDVLISNFTEHKLCRMPLKQGSQIINYYGTKGFILNSRMKPMMLASWQMEKIIDERGRYVYKFIRPILRISPEVFTDDVKDPMEKLIINKVAPTALAADIFSPRSDRDYVQYNNDAYHLKIEVDAFPFEMQTSDPPSISTTDEYLRNLILSHISSTA